MRTSHRILTAGALSLPLIAGVPATALADDTGAHTRLSEETVAAQVANEDNQGHAWVGEQSDEDQGIRLDVRGEQLFGEEEENNQARASAGEQSDEDQGIRLDVRGEQLFGDEEENNQAHASASEQSGQDENEGLDADVRIDGFGQDDDEENDEGDYEENKDGEDSVLDGIL